MSKFFTHFFARDARRFCRGDAGSASVEAVLWFPVFIAVFALMVDAAMIFSGHSRVMRVVQDANRNLSVNRFRDGIETETYIINQLATLVPNVTVDTVISADGLVATTTVLVPASDLEALGLYSILNNLTIPVVSQHIIEL